MRAPIVLAVAQPRSVLGDVDVNVARHADAVGRAEAQVVVFPELSLTGYSLDAEPVAPADPRLGPLVDACARHGTVALVGAPVANGDGRRSIAVLEVRAGEVRVAYRKMWLGAEELATYTPGDEPVRIDVDGWRLGLAICKDTGVPDHAAATAGLGIDIYVAGVCEAEEDRAVQPARAADTIAAHGVWVATAGFAGPTGGGFDRTAGRSTIWRPDGTVAAGLGPEPGGVATATIPAA